MDEELKYRFFHKKLEELLNGNTKPFPTLIIEQERLEITELIRKFCLFSPYMTPFKIPITLEVVPEKIEVHPVKDYGELYILVNLN